MKVLIADKLSEQVITGMRKLGCKVLFQPDLKAEDLKDNI